jgi:hypothetical protein
MQVLRAVLIVVSIYALGVGGILLWMATRSEVVADFMSLSTAGGMVTIVGVYGIIEAVYVPNVVVVVVDRAKRHRRNQ